VHTAKCSANSAPQSMHRHVLAFVPAIRGESDGENPMNQRARARGAAISAHLYWRVARCIRMVSNGADVREEAREVWELEACLARARAVRNAMSAAESALRSPNMPDSIREDARERIERAWKALSGRSVRTEDRRRVLDAIDCISRTRLGGVAAGEAVLARLPPESVMLLASHSEALGRVVETWRHRTPGRRPGDARGKWDECVALWQQATGKDTSASIWEKTWKDIQSDRERALRGGGPRSRKKKQGVTASPK